MSKKLTKKIIPEQKKVAIVVATPMTARVFLLDQIRMLAKIYDVTVVANLAESSDLDVVLPKSVHLENIPILRKINLYLDLYALINLVRLFRKEKFYIVHSVSPKAGLLAMLASRIAGITHRIHTFTGQVWATKQGLNKVVLRTIDKVIAGLATTVLVDSHSQRDFLVQNKVIKSNSSIVLGDGSISGVDLERFQPNVKMRSEMRRRLDTDNKAIVFLFVGRLKREKGVVELARAFAKIPESYGIIALWFVGPDEEKVQPDLEEILADKGRKARFVSFTKSPENYMMAADIFCLPSYREGFGSVIVEAAACGIPSIGSSIYGLSDAIEDGETGLLVGVNSVDELVAAMIQLSVNDDLRKKMGDSAQFRASKCFSQSRLTNEMVSLYNKLLSEQIKL